MYKNLQSTKLSTSSNEELPKTPEAWSNSIYIHFPFCEHRCHYCDFYVIAEDRDATVGLRFPEKKQQFLTTLLTEIQHTQASLSTKIDTVFFGGGTPSLTPIHELTLIAKELKIPTKLSQDYEWTVECNPGLLTLEYLQGLKTLGVNRLSLGVQTFSPALLTLLSRKHSREEALRSLELVKKAGFENVSVDLMCGIPEQSLADLEDSLELLKPFNLPHISLYLLTLPPKHFLGKKMPEESIQMHQLEWIESKLETMGLSRYEISNFCKPGFSSKHNLKYWKRENYLGLGPSAHSFCKETQTRWKNHNALHLWKDFWEKNHQDTQSSETVLGLPEAIFIETLTPYQQELENWMLGIRLIEGLPLNWIKTEGQKKYFKMAVNEGWIQIHQDRWSLTSKGKGLHEQIALELSPTQEDFNQRP